MSRRERPQGLRRRLTLAVGLAITVALGVMILAFNVILARRLDSDALSLLRSRNAAQLATLSTVNGRLDRIEAPDRAAVDSATWIFAERGVLEHPTAAAAVDRAAASLASGAGRTLDVPSPHTRLLAVPVLHGARRVGTVVSALSLGPYEGTRRTALVASLALGTALLLAVVLATRWLLGSALRPVARMTSDAAAWSEQHLDRRFGLGPPRDELTQLAATLDGLLDRLASSLRREQRFTSEVSHELRTPLSRIITEAQLALRAPDRAERAAEAMGHVLGHAQQLQRTLETLMAAARADSADRQSRSEAREVVRTVAAESAALAHGRGVRIDLDLPSTPLTTAVDPDLLARLLHPLIENACHHARTTVTIDARREGSEIRLGVRDDGPGVSERERERIFEPGVRGESAREGAGLGLALARRLATAARGHVRAEPDPAGGFFVVTVPAA